MHYWIDGYNLLFYLPKTNGSFEEKRRVLISQINEQAKLLSLQSTIVFDASDPSQKHDSRSHYDCLEIVYTHAKKSADDAILEAVEFSRNRANLCVVSSDKGLSLKAQALGAQILSLPEFLFFLFKKHKKKAFNQISEYQDSPKEIERLLKIFSKGPREEK